ncbi:MAG: hypothetical protein WBW16_00075 [Bacteroidota bacterium]
MFNAFAVASTLEMVVAGADFEIVSKGKNHGRAGVFIVAMSCVSCAISSLSDLWWND